MVVYAVVKQSMDTTQQLVAVKSCLAKKGLTIPHLELVAAHVATNLTMNVRNALNIVSITSLHSWMDSMVALHWIKGNG